MRTGSKFVVLAVALLIGNIFGSGYAATLINTADIADSAVTSAKIANGDVKSIDIANGGVANADLANNAVTSNKVSDGTIMFADVSPKFMKFGQLGNDAAGNSKGWIPDGVRKVFEISEPAAKGNSVIIVSLPQGAVSETVCGVDRIIPATSFRVSCTKAPVDTGVLNYIVVQV